MTKKSIGSQLWGPTTASELGNDGSIPLPFTYILDFVRIARGLNLWPKTQVSQFFPDEQTIDGKMY